MKKSLCNPRLLLGLFLLCGIVLLAALLFFSPVQGPVVLYKVALVVVAAIAGMAFDFLAFPYALPSSYLDKDWRKDPVPYPSFHLSNNNANIHRVQQRIDDLKNRGDFVGWEFPGGRAEINEGENRLQLFFDEKPTEEHRQELKHNGFKWAPSQGAWQRQLNRNAIFAAGRIDFLRTEDGQSPVRLQPFARREREEPSR